MGAGGGGVPSSFPPGRRRKPGVGGRAGASPDMSARHAGGARPPRGRERCPATHGGGMARALCWFLVGGGSPLPLFSLTLCLWGTKVKDGEGTGCLLASAGSGQGSVSLPHLPSSPPPGARERRPPPGLRALLSLPARTTGCLCPCVCGRVCTRMRAHTRFSFSPPLWLLSESEAGSAVEVLWVA